VEVNNQLASVLGSREVRYGLRLVDWRRALSKGWAEVLIPRWGTSIYGYFKSLSYDPLFANCPRGRFRECRLGIGRWFSLAPAWLALHTWPESP